MRALLLLALATQLHAAPPPAYHLELEANPAAPFPFLGKFGTVTLHVYPAGVRPRRDLLAQRLHAQRHEQRHVENPLGRMYTDVPLAQISATLRKLSTSGVESAAPGAITQITGNVKGIPARRYRLVYGPEAWIDVWMTDSIPENPQLREVVTEFVRGISPATAATIGGIHGTPLYVELNFRRYKKLPLVRLKNIAWNADGQDDALKTGTLYFKAPIWK